MDSRCTVGFEVRPSQEGPCWSPHPCRGRRTEEFSRELLHLHSIEGLGLCGHQGVQVGVGMVPRVLGVVPRAYGHQGVQVDRRGPDRHHLQTFVPFPSDWVLVVGGRGGRDNEPRLLVRDLLGDGDQGTL